MSYRDDRRQEVLDGQRSWSVQDAGGDADVFYTEFVLPLRDLRAEGMFQKLHEHESSRRGAKIIDRADIPSAINFHA
jgi:hypothetical protein